MFARRLTQRDTGSGGGKSRRGDKSIADVNLNQGKRMVEWFTPGLLFRAAFHDFVAGIFGQYADQRTIQQLEDPIPDDDEHKKEFICRYDYSQESPNGEPFWVDFAADLGDGFDSTYSVAYLLAADSLGGRSNPQKPNIRGVEGLSPDDELNHGRILIMGGDEVYPWPSRDEYAERLQKPYGWAHPPPAVDPATRQKAPTSRDVFAIPGNHDWYDGLNAFDSLFCRARDGGDEATLNTIGGWQTRQHRSYFAIKLPHNWWIWGADIQLSQALDAGQLNYFRTVSEQMNPGDKFVLCTAQPSWLYFGTPSEAQARDNLRHLIDMPIRNGATLCAIMSGDTHHYSRYVEDDELNGFNLFTAGGGGAYSHGTHHLKDTIEFDWVGKIMNFRLNRKLKPQPAEVGSQSPPSKTESRACYPNRAQSIWKVLTNVAFPFRNFSFSMAMGLIYWLFTWSLAELEVLPQFIMAGTEQKQVVEKFENIEKKRIEIRQNRMIQQKRMKRYNKVVPPSSSFDRPTSQQRQADNGRQVSTSCVEKENRPCAVRRWLLRSTSAHIKLSENLSWFESEHMKRLVSLAAYAFGLLVLGLASSPGTTIFVLLVWLVFYRIADSKRQGRGNQISRFMSGTAHFLLHVILMWGLFIAFTNYNETDFFDFINQYADAQGFLLWLPIEIWPRLLYVFEIIFFGGLLAGLVFGLYLGLTYILFKINSDWAFSAQASPDFRNFLRMRFEPNRLTVYPIGLHRPPRHRRWWLSGRPSGWVVNPDAEANEPRVEPRTPLRPHLIEGPIVIDANKVRNIPRR